VGAHPYGGPAREHWRAAAAGRGQGDQGIRRCCRRCCCRRRAAEDAEAAAAAQLLLPGDGSYAPSGPYASLLAGSPLYVETKAALERMLQARREA